MHLSKILASVAFAGNAAALVPRSYKVPSTDGFPYPSDSQEFEIAQRAFGKLPGGPIPSQLGPGSTTAFQLIAFNELFETAFFDSLLYNITNKVKGYEPPKGEFPVAEKFIRTVLAQEEQHAIAALSLLKSAKKFQPSPCKYQFPVDNLADAIGLAETFTAVVLGALQGANKIFASEGLPGIVQVISSVIGQEGEQNGIYRVFFDLIPSESPFLTYVPAAFAWSALQNFVVPNSCPYSLDKIALPIFPPLLANEDSKADVKPEDQTIKFKANVGKDQYGKHHDKDLFITYINGQNLPISVKAKNVKWEGNTVKLDADFPYEKNIFGGLTVAALTTADTFTDADAVVKCTIAAPGIIQVLEPLS